MCLWPAWVFGPSTAALSTRGALAYGSHFAATGRPRGRVTTQALGADGQRAGMFGGHHQPPPSGGDQDQSSGRSQAGLDHSKAPAGAAEAAGFERAPQGAQVGEDGAEGEVLRRARAQAAGGEVHVADCAVSAALPNSRIGRPAKGQEHNQDEQSPYARKALRVWRGAQAQQASAATTSLATEIADAGGVRG